MINPKVAAISVYCWHSKWVKLTTWWNIPQQSLHCVEIMQKILT